MYVARRLMPVSGSPNTSTSPPVMGSNPAMIFKSVDLPQPLGPTIETNVPAAMSRLMRSRAVCVPNCLTTSLSVSARGVSPDGMRTLSSPRRGKLAGVDAVDVDLANLEPRVGYGHESL